MDAYARLPDRHLAPAAMRRALDPRPPLEGCAIPPFPPPPECLFSSPAAYRSPPARFHPSIVSARIAFRSPAIAYPWNPTGPAYPTSFSSLSSAATS